MATGSGCIHHEAIQRQHDTNVKNHDEIWRAIDRLREDIKSLIWKIGFTVGGITVIQSVAMLLIQNMGKS